MRYNQRTRCAWSEPRVLSERMANMAEKSNLELTFEAGLDRLETIVRDLEQGDLQLEKALALFEEGVQVSGHCRKKLEEAESRVEILLKKGDGKVVAEPFRPGDSDSPS